MDAVLVSLGIAAVLLALHPFVSYPLSLMALARRIAHPQLGVDASIDPPAPPQMSFCICVCAYNEERVIRRKAENLLSLRREIPNLEVLVYVDAADDRTVRRLAPYARDFRIYVGNRRLGKTSGMKHLVSMTNASIVIFTDANVMLDARSLRNLRRHFADPAVGCVCGHLRYVNAAESAAAATGSLYWRLEESIKRMETASGSVMGADGSLFAIRRELFDPPPDHIIDDMFVSFRILCRGYRIVQAADVVAYEESVASTREEFARKTRIACQGINAHRLLWPQLRRQGRLNVYKYISHKYLRWLSIYFFMAGDGLILAGLADAGCAGLTEVLVAAQLAIVVLGGGFGLRPFSIAWNFLIALAGAGFGVLRAGRGDHYRTWTPAASIRR